MKNLVNKTINLSLKGEDGDRCYLVGAFITQAKRERWTYDEITKVTTEALEGDYEHCLAVFQIHCSPKDGE